MVADKYSDVVKCGSKGFGLRSVFLALLALLMVALVVAALPPRQPDRGTTGDERSETIPSAPDVETPPPTDVVRLEVAKTQRSSSASQKPRFNSRVEGRVLVIPTNRLTGEVVRPSRMWIQEVRSLNGEDVYVPRKSFEAGGNRLGMNKISAEGEGYSVPYMWWCRRLRVGVRADGLAQGWTPVLELDGKESAGPVRVPMDPGAKLCGQVILATTRQPFTSGEVILLAPFPDGRFREGSYSGIRMRQNFDSVESVRLSSDGRFAFSELADGEYALRIMNTYRLPIRFVGEIMVKRDHPEDPLLVRVGVGGTITGRVLLPGGVADITDRVGVAVHNQDGWSHTRALDETGRYCLGPLEAGRHYLQLLIADSWWSTAGYFEIGGSWREPADLVGAVDVREDRDIQFTHDLSRSFGAVVGMASLSGEPAKGKRIYVKVTQRACQETADILQFEQKRHLIEVSETGGSRFQPCRSGSAS